MDDKKNIVFFMPYISRGGVEKNLYSISNFFSDKIDNIYICSSSKKFKYKFNKKIKFIAPKKNFKNEINIRFRYFYCLYLLLIFLIKKKNSIVFSFQANIYCIIICKILNIKIIARSNTSPSGWGHNKLKKIIYRKIIKLADEVVTNSIDFKNQMNKNFKIKSTFIYNPLNIDEIRKKSLKYSRNFFDKSNKIKLLSIGRFTEQKDQLTLLKAAKNLKDKNFPFKLILVGEGIEKIELNKYIKENNLSGDVKLINFLENPFPILRQTDLFLLSSKYEGLPNVIIEAAVLKKPIISTNCPTGPKEILGNGKGGYMYKIGDYLKLSKIIKRYSNNKKEFNKKKNYLYKSLDRFNYKKNLKSYYNLINRHLN